MGIRSVADSLTNTKLESVAVSAESLHPHPQICEALYASTTIQDFHGRIVVNLPLVLETPLKWLVDYSTQ